MHKIGLDLSHKDARFAWEIGMGLCLATTNEENIDSIVRNIIQDTGKTVTFTVGTNPTYDHSLEPLIIVRFHGDQKATLEQIKERGMKHLYLLDKPEIEGYAAAVGALFYGR